MRTYVGPTEAAPSSPESAAATSLNGPALMSQTLIDAHSSAVHRYRGKAVFAWVDPTSAVVGVSYGSALASSSSSSSSRQASIGLNVSDSGQQYAATGAIHTQLFGSGIGALSPVSKPFSFTQRLQGGGEEIPIDAETALENSLLQDCAADPVRKRQLEVLIPKGEL